jgi:hypothetical protein
VARRRVARRELLRVTGRGRPRELRGLGRRVASGEGVLGRRSGADVEGRVAGAGVAARHHSTERDWHIFVLLSTGLKLNNSKSLH